ncbi:ferric/cupric-chelate reductase [Linnemannia gamsii]|uniref:Ferric/cupric-chelate reductase n=1 Tax=Linnemannia gamsii TaxID=64522 RepID=A0ABQ7KG75_9FUNG|nr:ferric/cupric-chelate reductase [Linnemannia gamsii]
MAETYKVISVLGGLMLTIFWIGDYSWLWTTKNKVLEVYFVGLRDYYFWGYCISPAIISHFVTIWGHYYRADSIFQRSISQVSWPSALTLSERVDKRLNQISFWEKKDGYFGYTVKYWFLSFIAFAVNMVWFIQPITKNIGKALDDPEGDAPWAIWAAYIGFGSGYAAMGACGMILLLVLRRSMLHALGFTYADLLPLHRGMGFAIIFWSVLHTVGYMAHFAYDNEFAAEINFDGETRGPQNIVGFVALAAMLAMAILSLPVVRRRCYWLFIVSHRYLTIISLAGTLMHYPYFMTWYYVVPSMCLFLADRFIPKIVQAFSVGREVVCSFDEHTDIVTIVITSRSRLEPMKPYYPGDYISLQLRCLGEIYHPFTIASYWPEDPYSMTLYIRTFGDNKDSWTRQLAALCGQSGKSVLLPMNVEGVFGDRMHDYLCSDEIVIFAAGAAITTFMPLIKSIAARIDAEAASGVPQKSLRMYLICTFRYESELYSYGDFLHQITHDVRFTSWLRTSIHVSRAEKIPRVITSSDNIPPSSPVESIETVAQEEQKPQLLGDVKKTSGSIAYGKIEVADNRYQGRVLPTFLAADSARISTIHAVRDLAITAAILLIPFAAYIGIRYTPIEGYGEGKYFWCQTTRIYDQNMTNKCMWNYTMTPGVVQIGVASLIGYVLMYLGRRLTRREADAAKNATDDGATSGNTRAYLESVLRTQIMEYDGTIPFKPSRLDVEKYITDLMAEDIGMGNTKAVKKDAGKNEVAGKTTTVFAGGPDGFLDSVEKANRKAKWSVDFHRETWSP